MPDLGVTVGGGTLVATALALWRIVRQRRAVASPQAPTVDRVVKMFDEGLASVQSGLARMGAAVAEIPLMQVDIVALKTDVRRINAEITDVRREASVSDSAQRDHESRLRHLESNRPSDRAHHS